MFQIEGNSGIYGNNSFGSSIAFLESYTLYALEVSSLTIFVEGVIAGDMPIWIYY